MSEAKPLLVFTANHAYEMSDLIHVETPKVPPPTIEQQLAWATTRCAELQARLLRLQGKAMEAKMFLSLGECSRTMQSIDQIIIDL